jgi:2-desacetyl-2-hydroxyethyl bacteriochlorophyllide A dehydrogenase
MGSVMLALQKIRAEQGVGLAQTADPGAPAPHELLIKIAATGICGTDLHLDHWAEGFRFIAPLLPITLGHEFTGEVIAIGSETSGFVLGDRVVVQPALSCMQVSGGFASHVRAPAKHCLHVPASVDAELGALIEPLTTSAHAVSLAEIKPGARVVVFGPGPIGQGAAIFARKAGAVEVAVVGHGDTARFATLRKLGFDSLVDLADPDGASRLTALAGAGFDVALEASGAPPVINIGLASLRPYGTFILAGMPERQASLDVMLIVRGRHKMIGCSRAPDSAWHTVIEALVADPETFRPMITHRLPLAEALAGFELAHSKAASKVLLFP